MNLFFHLRSNFFSFKCGSDKESQLTGISKSKSKKFEFEE